MEICFFIILCGFGRLVIIDYVYYSKFRVILLSRFVILVGLIRVFFWELNNFRREKFFFFLEWLFKVIKF